jgi:spore germination protein YaaH
MNKYCDRIELMAYDQGTINVRLNNARRRHGRSPGWVENMVILAACATSIPTYGYEYTVTPLPNGRYQYKVLWPFNPRYATEIAAKLGISPQVQRNGVCDDAAGGPPYRFPNQQSAIASTTVAQNAGSQVTTVKPFNYMTWSDAQAIADKVAMARKLGVRGVAIFKFDGGEDPLMWDVLK